MGRLLGSRRPGRLIVLLTGALSLAHWLGLIAAAMVHQYQSLSMKALLLGAFGNAALIFVGLMMLDRPKAGSQTLTRVLEAPRTRLWWVAAVPVAAWVTTAVLMIPWNDENSNIAAAQYLFEHGWFAYFANYGHINSWLGPHHPPLLPLLYAGIYRVFGFSVGVGRTFAILCSIAAAWLGYRWLVQRFDRRTALVTLLCLPTIPVVLFAGTASILDAPFWLVFTATLATFDLYLRNGKNSSAIAAGVLLALAMLSRYNAILLPPIFLAVLWVEPDYRLYLRRGATWLILATPILLLVPWVAAAGASGALAVQVKQIASFAFTAFVPEGGAFYLKQIIIPLVPFMIGLFNVPVWINGALVSWRDEKGRFGRVPVAIVATYFVILLLSLPNPRYVLSPAIPLAYFCARQVLDSERREGRGLELIIYLLGLSLLHVAIVLQQTSSRTVYLFY